jgi:IrrE N-terminal-like domain
MTRPDDSLLQPHELATVQKQADRLLKEASAIGRFPTPIADLLATAKLTVVDDEELNESSLQHFMRKARAGVKAGVEVIKSALSKVWGMLDPCDGLVVIDKNTPKLRVPFIKLHETGHNRLPHQQKMYRLMQDCEESIDPDITDLFEREANVFASEVFFQGEVFSNEAHGQSFSIKVPMGLADKFGASRYSAFRRYVTTNPHACCVVALEPPTTNLEDGARSAEVRRVVMSKSFEALYDGQVLCSKVTGAHPLVPVIPAKRMTFDREVVLKDRNGDERLCIAEALDTKHQVLVLIRDIGPRTRAGIIVLPAIVRVSYK